MDISLVRQLALEAHRGQVDQQGRDYYEAHLAPIAAGLVPFGEEAEAAGWLHDILEDTDLSVVALRRVAPDRVVRAVVSVSRRPDETYGELIGRACADELGRIVKLADNAWNITCNPGLAQLDRKKARSMLRDRYEPARQRLLEACGWDLDSPDVRMLYATLSDQYQRLAAG